MKRVKLYAFQSVIDNSKFKNYGTLSEIAVKYVNQLYEHQRRYNTYIYPASADLALILGDYRISQLVKQSLCDQQNINLYLNVAYLTSIYPKKSYSSAQCESIEDGILKQGLRPALIAFTEILYNFTKVAHTTDQMMTGAKFKSIIKMQKYI